jgi:hypothetical protein
MRYRPERLQITTGPIHLAFWITKAANKHSECVIAYLLVFYGSSGYVNAPQCYIVLTLPLLLYTFLSVLYVCVDFFSNLKAKIDVGSLLHNNKEKTTYPLGCYG